VEYAVCSRTLLFTWEKGPRAFSAVQDRPFGYYIPQGEVDTFPHLATSKYGLPNEYGVDKKIEYQISLTTDTVVFGPAAHASHEVLN
jgi:hypothetical protein